MANDSPQKRTLFMVTALLFAVIISNVNSLADTSVEVNCRPKGSMVAWGSNEDGQCDVPNGNDFISISGGGQHSLAIRSDGSLVAWGGE